MHSRAQGTATKLTSRIPFPAELDITRYCADDVRLPGGRYCKRSAVTDTSQATAGDDDEADDHTANGVAQEDAGGAKVLYDLSGVVVHSGSIIAGHYTAYVRLSQDLQSIGSNLTATNDTANKQSGADSDQWFFISDSRVRTATLDEVLKREAYILFYTLRPAAATVEAPPAKADPLEEKRQEFLQLDADGDPSSMVVFTGSGDELEDAEQPTLQSLAAADDNANGGSHNEQHEQGAGQLTIAQVAQHNGDVPQGASSSDAATATATVD